MLSLGFRFHPTDEELINYLKNVVLHGMLPPRDFIKVADLFEDLEPWEIMAGSEEQTHYFLSQLKRFKNSTKKFSRTVGKGTWKGQNSGNPIEDNGLKKNTTIGYKRNEYFRKSSKNYTFVICKIKEKKKNKGEEVDDEFIDYVLESIPDNHQLITNDDDNQFAVNYEVMRTITLHEDYGGGVEDFNGIDHLLLGVEDINDENCCIDYDELLEIIG
ncbi:putative NAC domain-containing protein 94 [Capsicum annuum]|uniref:putative NAC domain-containing protein 94 n=1 Tax=Capsicum annuum TaxID=4072 RepID=UPI0007BF75E7|nr:putative NAC domain-containing protein 94 [Capsicum annuum]